MRDVFAVAPRYERDSEQFKKEISRRKCKEAWLHPIRLMLFIILTHSFCLFLSFAFTSQEHELLLNRWADESAKFMCASVYRNPITGKQITEELDKDGVFRFESRREWVLCL